MASKMITIKLDVILKITERKDGTRVFSYDQNAFSKEIEKKRNYLMLIPISEVAMKSKQKRKAGKSGK